MCLCNIDDEKLRAGTIGLVYFFKHARLAAEGRSGDAAENEHERLRADQRRQQDGVAVSQACHGQCG